jgi:hypothetical protein
MRRLDLAGDALPSSRGAFVERHLGTERQLTALRKPASLNQLQSD